MAKQGLKWVFSHRGSVWKWILNKCEAWICNSAPSAWYENCSTCVTGSRSPASYLSLSLASTLFTLLKDQKQQLNCEGLSSLNKVLVLLLWLRFTGQPCKEGHSKGPKGPAASPLSAQNRPVRDSNTWYHLHHHRSSLPPIHRAPCWYKIMATCVDYSWCPWGLLHKCTVSMLTLGSKIRQVTNLNQELC